MCGIAGIIDLEGRIGREALAAIARTMASAMPYRGPDDEGVWVDPAGRCALSHRRLSIIDTSAAGHQPWLLDDGQGALTFNGEIYNFLELRAELAAAGQRFASHSDTEVLAAMLRGNGIDALERLDGQFAFGFYRTAARELLLARDPFGEKPLYWCRHGGLFAFASELHALTAVPGFDDGVDQDAIAEYLALQYIDAPRTIYRGAQKLPPGHWLRLDAAGEVRLGRHFAFEPRGPATGTRPIGELAEELESIMLRMVRRRMIADVPLGAFLSGGVDSSTVVALMTKALGGRVKTFSIGFDGTEETEHLFAREMAEHLGTEHHEQVLQIDVLDLLQHIGRSLDEPNGDSSCLPTFLVSRVAKQHVTVCLSGDGGDELFGGYGRYFHTLQEEAAALAGDPAHASWDAGNAYWSGRSLVYLDGHLEQLFGAVPPRTAALLAGLRRQARSRRLPLLHRMRRLDAEHYMPGAVLAKVDRMSMLHSLEVRTPFLSREMAAFAEQMPIDALVRNGQGKLVLKEMAQRYIPRQLLDRKKMGFGVPVQTRWGRERMNGWLQDLLLGSDCRLADWIERPAREAFVARSGRDFSFYQAWLMLLLENWLRARPARRIASQPAVGIAGPVRLDTVERPAWQHEDLRLWQWLRERGQPVSLFTDGDLPALAWHLPAGSAVVGPDLEAMPAGLVAVTSGWRIGAVPDLAALAALPTGIALFPCHAGAVAPDVLELAAQPGSVFLHRFDGHWCEVADGNTVELRAAAGVRRLGGLDRLRSRRMPAMALQAAGGHGHRFPLPQVRGGNGRLGQVEVFENGVALPTGPASVQAVRLLGRGRYAVEDGAIVFAASDNSDPVANRRRYDVLVRGSGGAALAPLRRSPLGWMALGVAECVQRWLQPAGSVDERRLREPFVAEGGHCWRSPIRRMLIPRRRLQEGWRLLLCEDGVPLPHPDAIHDDIRGKGQGRYSVWDGWVFFSASDGSDPTRNGRRYTVRVLPPLAVARDRAAAAGQGAVLAPRWADEAAFHEALQAWIAEDLGAGRPRLGPGGSIALVVGSLNAGGTERQVVKLALELDRRGFAVTVLCLAGLQGEGSHYRQILSGARAVRVLAADRVDPAFAPDALTADPDRLDLLVSLPPVLRDDVFRLCSHLQGLAPTVLHCSLDPTNIAGGIAGLLLGVPRIVLGARSVNPTNFPAIDRPHFQPCYRLLARSPRIRLGANSAAGGADYERWLGLPAGSFRVVPNGIDPTVVVRPADDAVAAFRAEQGIPDGAPVLAGVLRFTEEKRPLLFVEVAARVLAAVPGLRVMLAGAGPMAAEVERAIDRHGVRGRLLVLGRRHDVATVIRAADVLLLCSRQEGMPNVLLEAQSLERPVVATRVGGAPECLIEGETGLLAARDDAAGLADACVQLLRDPDRCRRMGRAGAAFVAAGFSLQRMVDATLDMYDCDR